MSSPSPAPESPRIARLALTLGALGVVFGDIGTSPLYTMRECLTPLQGDPTTGVLGVLSLIFWAFVMVVSVKYLTVLLRADNRGEGGIFALLALQQQGEAPQRRVTIGVLVVLTGAAFLYGDGMITPAISVLAAAEGFKGIIPGVEPWIPLIACLILGGLFWLQHKGTHNIGRLFGPVLLVWFAVIGGLGAWHIAQYPRVLMAVNPVWGARLLASHPGQVTFLLGGVVLAITGVEALYADMGHFGRAAIVRAWYFVVLPGLVLNYFGQGAHVLAQPGDLRELFFSLAPDGLPRLLFVLLSIVATIIASQALISGTFSLTRQAIQLGFVPRLSVRHTSAEVEGQIYLPLVNRLLAIGTLAIVLGFKTSDALAGAYGMAVTGAMTMTTLAFFVVARKRWGWSVPRAMLVCGVFLVIDLALLFSNLHKVVQGGWLPLATGLGVLVVMHTWKRGREEIYQRVYGRGLENVEVKEVLEGGSVVRVSGTAVFMAANPRGTPLALLHHLKSNRSLQKTAVLLTISAEQVPHVADGDRLVVSDLGSGVWRAVGRYGYMESPQVSALIDRIRAAGVQIEPMTTTYYFNREMILTGGDSRLWEWQKSLYAFLGRNARPAKDYYHIPPTQIIEIGLPIQL